MVARFRTCMDAITLTASRKGRKCSFTTGERSISARVLRAPSRRTFPSRLIPLREGMALRLIRCSGMASLCFMASKRSSPPGDEASFLTERCDEVERFGDRRGSVVVEFGESPDKHLFSLLCPERFEYLFRRNGKVFDPHADGVAYPIGDGRDGRT